MLYSTGMGGKKWNAMVDAVAKNILAGEGMRECICGAEQQISNIKYARYSRL
jgi:hypothetical protein